MKILAFTTATPRCSVVVVDGDLELARGGYDDEMRHAERLFGVVDEVLGAAKLRRDEIDAIACDVGPGSFTGVRVGLASAKGMALGLEIPLVGVCGLAAMADAARQTCPEGVVVPVTDGKRGELFLAAYDAQGAEVLSPRSFASGKAAVRTCRVRERCRALWRCPGHRRGSWPRPRRGRRHGVARCG